MALLYELIITVNSLFMLISENELNPKQCVEEAHTPPPQSLPMKKEVRVK